MAVKKIPPLHRRVKNSFPGALAQNCVDGVARGVGTGLPHCCGMSRSTLHDKMRALGIRSAGRAGKNVL